MEAGGEVDSVVTIRLIRSFAHRNIRNVVLRNVDFGQSVAQFTRLVQDKIVAANSGLPPPFKNFAFDCMKIEHQAHGSKTSDPVINCENDEKLLMRNLDRSLCSYNVQHETSISFFKRQDYEDYKKNPTLKW